MTCVWHVVKYSRRKVIWFPSPRYKLEFCFCNQAVQEFIQCSLLVTRFVKLIISIERTLHLSLYSDVRGV